MVQQTEFMGLPFSQGGAGGGIRILLGSDLLPYKAAMAPNTSDFNNQQQTMGVDKSTRWLIPGSPAAFDPRCSVNDIDAAYDVNCSLVGTFESCTIGCNLDDRQEQIWAGLPLSILGIPRETWTLASGEAWNDIRGMLSGYTFFTNQTKQADALFYMENPPSTAYVEPFTGMTDRTFWIGKGL